MIHHIYGVKVINGEKERRYYGEVETLNDAKCALMSIIGDVDYAYAKEGSSTVIYVDQNSPYLEYSIAPTAKLRPCDPTPTFWPDQRRQLHTLRE